MDPSSRTAFLSIAALVLAAGAASGCGPEPPERGMSNDGTTASATMLLCGERPYVGPFGVEQKQQEAYYLPALNRMLAYQPDFAAWMGIQSVSDCEGARAFVAGYLEYTRLHPDVVWNPVEDPEPFEIPGPPPTPPAEAPPGVRPKVFNGTEPEQEVLPIVRIQNVTVGCTGTFISRNWILTAAHCLVRPMPGDVPAGPGNLPPTDYFRYTVERSMKQPDGTFLPVAMRGGPAEDPFGIKGWQIPHEKWAGGSDTDHDIALIWLYPVFYDPFLPESFDKGAMRISYTPPGAALTLWGWGLTDEQAPSSTLRFGPNPLTTFQVSTLQFFHTIPHDPNAPPDSRVNRNDASVCAGDSGGPATRTVTAGPNGARLVTNGVAADFEPRSGVKQGDPGFLCAIVQGQREHWVRTDRDSYINWIMATMKLWYGKEFTCRSFPNDDGAFFDYYRCWGDECTVDNQTCSGSQVCKGLQLNPPFANAHPVRIGQCLPLIHCSSDKQCPVPDKCLNNDFGNGTCGPVP